MKPHRLPFPILNDGPYPREERAIHLVELEDGRNTHIALEVMGRQQADWIPLAVVSVADLLGSADVRQFPVFRLAWYGQARHSVADAPQRGEPEQDFITRCTAIGSGPCAKSDTVIPAMTTGAEMEGHG